MTQWPRFSESGNQYTMYFPISYTIEIYSIVLTTINQVEGSGVWSMIKNSPNPLIQIMVGRGSDYDLPNTKDDISSLTIGI